MPPTNNPINSVIFVIFRIMPVTIELDKKLIEKIDEISKVFKKNRVDYITEVLTESINNDLRRDKIAEKERRAVEAYRRFPIQPDEFEVEEEQLIEAWKDL